MNIINNPNEWTQQQDDFLRARFPGGSIPFAMMMLTKTAYQVRCRIIYLNLDPNMIFETVKPLKQTTW